MDLFTQNSYYYSARSYAFLNTKDFVEHGYGNYASADVNIFGWGCILFVVIFADFLTTLKGKEGYADLDKISQKEVAKK